MNFKLYEKKKSSLWDLLSDTDSQQDDSFMNIIWPSEPEYQIKDGAASSSDLCGYQPQPPPVQDPIAWKEEVASQSNFKNFIEEEKEVIQVEEGKVYVDHILILKAIQKNLSIKTSEKCLTRCDVLIKSLFRILRQFYQHKLNEILGPRRKNHKPDILRCLDQLIINISQNFKVQCEVSRESLSNHLGALILPKCIQQMHDNSACHDNGTKASNELQHNASVFSNQMLRFLQIKNIAAETRLVLYKYNKRNFKGFCRNPANIYLLKYFIHQAQQVFVNYPQYLSDYAKFFSLRRGQLDAFCLDYDFLISLQSHNKKTQRGQRKQPSEYQQVSPYVRELFKSELDKINQFISFHQNQPEQKSKKSRKALKKQ